MSTSFDFKVLQVASKANIADHFQKVQLSASQDASTEQLLRAIERGSVRADVFQIWLGTSHSPIVVQKALEQTFSVEVRASGIKQFGKDFQSSRWRETWDALGGVQGLLELCSKFSVQEIRKFCQAIVQSSKGQDLDEKRERVTTLAKAFQPLEYPDAEFKSSDNRPLSHHYRKIVAACSSELVVPAVEEGLRGDEPFSSQERKRLLRHHSDTLKGIVFKDEFKYWVEAYHFQKALLNCCPSAAGIDDRFSASMQFSLDMLRKVCDEDATSMAHSTYIDDLIQPLLRRSLRKKVSWIRKKEIFDLTLRYLEKYSEASKQISWDRGKLIKFAAVCWSRHSEWFEHHLSTLIQYANTFGRKAELGDYAPYMRGMAKGKRYDFLKICIKTTNQVDIDSETELKQFPDTWDPVLFQDLDVQNALQLLQRLRRARGSQTLLSLSPWDSIMCMSILYGSDYGDSNVLELLLTQQNGNREEAEKLALPLIEGRMKMAATESDQPTRQHHAISVLYIAIASGSLAIFKDVILWSRRFVKDPITVLALFRDYPKETYDILCGIPKNTLGRINPDMIQTAVKKANEVLWILFETVVLALREPSFALDHWKRTLNLFWKAVDSRLKGAEYLERKIGLDSSCVYEIVWEDTLEVLLKVEEECLKSDNERLKLNTVGGILAAESSSEWSEIWIIKEAPLSTYRFFDSLARRRDELWQRFRPKIFPTVAALPAPYPRGLPWQHLVGPYEIIAMDLDAVCPYIASRVNAVVYFDPTTALAPVPTNKDMREAIGLFVEDYRVALSTHIPSDLDATEKKVRVDRAWNHLAHNVKSRHMSDAEVLRYWHSIFKEVSEDWSREHGLTEEFEEWPVVPDVDDPTRAEEWNPLPSKKEDIPERSLEPLTYLDLAEVIGQQKLNPKVETKFVSFDAKIPGTTHPPHNPWWMSRAEEAKRGFPAVAEGQILSAILYLDSVNGSKERVATKPFPQDHGIRYPSLYLDEEFLSNRKLTYEQAIAALEVHVKTVPPPLLAQLVEKTVSALKPPGLDRSSAKEDAMGFELLELLTKCDRPSLASDLIVKTILQRPDASAWHRSLLSPGFFKRLSASDARACFKAFASAILTTLQSRNDLKEKPKSKTQDEGSDTTITEPTEPSLKITTIKYLAQLLQNADFLSQDFSLEILSELAEKCSHIDVRAAILSSLLTMLKASPEQQKGEILKVLEIFIPVAGNLNERHPLSEAAWDTALKFRTPPTVESSPMGVSPILWALLNFRESAPADFQHMKAYTSNIILPILSLLRQQNERWILIFLLSHNIPEADQEAFKVPSPPRNRLIWHMLLRTETSHLPSSVLDDYNRWVTFNIAPPTTIAALNKTLREDPALSSAPANKRWLAHYGQGLAVADKTLDAQILLDAVPYPPNPTTESESEIRLTHVQQHILSQWTVILLHDSPLFNNIHSKLQSLRPQVFTKVWADKSRPVVEAMVLYVDSMRSREWERDEKRTLSVLPDLWEQRLWLLPFPTIECSAFRAAGKVHTVQDHEEACKAFASQIDTLIDRITGTVYHNKFAAIKEVLRFVHGKDRLRVALNLGDTSKGALSWVTVRDMLRVELAAHLLNGAKMEEGDLKERVEVLRKGWRESGDEEVRRVGWVVKWDGEGEEE